MEAAADRVAAAEASSMSNDRCGVSYFLVSFILRPLTVLLDLSAPRVLARRS